MTKKLMTIFKIIQENVQNLWNLKENYKILCEENEKLYQIIKGIDIDLGMAFDAIEKISIVIGKQQISQQSKSQQTKSFFPIIECEEEIVDKKFKLN